MVIKMDAASHWLSERVGVQLTIFPSKFFTKKEQLRGPLPFLLLFQDAFPAELLAASRHWGRNSSGTDKWQMPLAFNYTKGREYSRNGALSPSPRSQPLGPQQCLGLDCCCSVAKSCQTSLQSHGPQGTSLPCPSLSLRVCSNSCPLNRWCHPTISSSGAPSSW